MVRQKAFKNDPITNLLLKIVANPDLGDEKKYIQPLHSVYRQPARQGHFSINDNIIFIREIFDNDVKYINLRIVPSSQTKIIHVVFHVNPIGWHINVYRTYHRIRQRYFWTGMYQYCKCMYKVFSGYSLSNITQNRCADLVYSFPIKAPMQVLFVNICASGTEINFDVTKHYLIAACGMNSFGICKPQRKKTHLHLLWSL